MSIATFANAKYIINGNISQASFNNIRIDDHPNPDGSYSALVSTSFFDTTFPATYLGHTGAGEPVFFVNNQTTILTNNSYSNGAPAPAYTPAATFVACFLTGTLISTPQGLKSVETLVPGDLVLTLEGQAIPVKWIGRQTVATMFGASDERAAICISAGALGVNRPTRDLNLTADHALLIDGVLIQAGALVNGMTICRMTQAETGPVYTVFHIETEGHEIILAEGCPAETFVDNVTRARFDNYDEYLELYGEEGAAIPEIDLPRVKSARQLPKSLRDLIAVRHAA